ncbi:hypothetical protein VCUG_01188 [Vavraia culicis subsp. floridensis]|uniref:Uncharacterized protein n=1 Tax=Vavraia culicis (isolate floridensis) TaxID=948595 RepID=L2GUJ8_VAVCU|nr:uncharacterized protein VCUG_01188 [Vavraia culicis subsp. floridensis]ELA47304.1 hypothetical protein VCUG_01188 [Vavraia culicis subsp. floridensis]
MQNGVMLINVPFMWNYCFEWQFSALIFLVWSIAVVRQLFFNPKYLLDRIVPNTTFHYFAYRSLSHVCTSCDYFRLSYPLAVYLAACTGQHNLLDIPAEAYCRITLCRSYKSH